MPNADLVLEGGGVKGLALVGAVRRLMRERYEFCRVAGTSAGSVVAAFLAAGATEEQLATIMDKLEYPRVPDRARPRLPLLSEGISLFSRRGAFQGDYIRDFVYRELKELGVMTFADLRRDDPKADKNLDPYRKYKLVVMATDITNGRLLRLPWDYHEKLHLDPDKQFVADAVRASISIPLYFEPVTVRDGRTGKEIELVDGGVLSNFPIQIFDRTDGGDRRWPTLGIKVMPPLPASSAELFPSVALPKVPPIRLIEQVLLTALFGHDQTYLERPCVRRRVIEINTRAVGIVEFNADIEKRARTVSAGKDAADAFLKQWDWEAFKAECPPVPAEVV